MSVKPRLSAGLPEGHGLVPGLAEQLYSAVTKGEPETQVVVLAVFDAVSWGGTKPTKSRPSQRTVQLSAVRLEVVPKEDVHRVRQQIEELYQVRTSKGGVMRLPLGFADEKEERRRELIEHLEAWADANGYEGGWLETRWTDLLGEGEAAGHYKDGSYQHLLQFAHTLGAVEDEKPPKAEPDAEAGGDNPADGFPDEAEAAEAARNAPPAPPAAEFTG